jgi:hypothetical protein
MVISLASKEATVDSVSREPQNQTSLSRAVSTSHRPSAAPNGVEGLARSTTTVNKMAAPLSSRNALNRNEPKPKARMIYSYEASTGFEVSALGKSDSLSDPTWK